MATMHGSDGDDTIKGGSGDDTIDGGAGDDTIKGDSGDDTITGGAGDDTIDGGEGDDTINAGSGDDVIRGGAGDDTIKGGSGDDTITGGAGDDTLTGDSGADTFVFGPGHGHDRITDFTDGEDVIDLSQISGVTGFDDLTITQDGDDTVIDLSAHDGGTIRLENFDVDDLDANDFLFQETPVETSVDGM